MSVMKLRLQMISLMGFVPLCPVHLNIVESYQWVCRADSAAVAITTTDLVSKSVAIESQVCKYLVSVSICADVVTLTKLNQA